MNTERLLLVLAVPTLLTVGLGIMFATQLKYWILRSRVRSEIAALASRISNLSWLSKDSFQLPQTEAICCFHFGDRIRKPGLQISLPANFFETFWIRANDNWDQNLRGQCDISPIKSVKLSLDPRHQHFVYFLESEPLSLERFRRQEAISVLDELFLLGATSISASDGRLLIFLPLAVIRKLESSAIIQLDSKITSLMAALS